MDNGSEGLFNAIIDALRKSHIGGNSITGIAKRLSEAGVKDVHRLYLTGFLEAMALGGVLERIDIGSSHFFFLPENAEKFRDWTRDDVHVRKKDLKKYQFIMSRLEKDA